MENAEFAAKDLPLGRTLLLIDCLSHKKSFLNKILFGMFSDMKLNYSSKKRPSDSMVLNNLSARFTIPRLFQSLVFGAKNSHIFDISST